MAVCNTEADVQSERTPMTPSLILVGHFATGKTSVAKQLARATGTPMVEIGDVVRDRARRAGSRSTLEHAADILTKGDRLVFVTDALQRARKASGEPFIIVGVRTVDELEFLRAALDRPPVTVALSTTDSLRRSRWANRNRAPEFDWGIRDSLERSWGVDEVVLSADEIIDSSPPLEEVVKEVQEVWHLAERKGQS